jgi:D-inositol-3-phosphate glycosyltransferase
MWQVERATIEDNVYRLLQHNIPREDLDRKRRVLHPLGLRRRCRQFAWALACRRNRAISYKALDALKPDVAYVWNMHGVGADPVLAAQQRGIPIVFNLYDYWLADLRVQLELESSWLRRSYRAVLTGFRNLHGLDSRTILVCSRSMMQTHVELGFPEQSIHIVPLGIPAQLITNVDDLPDSHQLDGGKVRLAFVGRLVPEKGPDVAIKAMVHLVEEMGMGKSSLDVIGTGPEGYVRELKRLAAVLGLTEQVRFVGKLEHGQVLARYAGYDALLFTSRWAEPFGMAIVEAMARGLPVIATDCGGVPDIIADGENGLLVPPDEPRMLAGAIARLAQERDLMRRIRSAAVRTVSQQYTIERIVSQAEQHLQIAWQQAVSQGIWKAFT